MAPPSPRSRPGAGRALDDGMVVPGGTPRVPYGMARAAAASLARRSGVARTARGSRRAARVAANCSSGAPKHRFAESRATWRGAGRMLRSAARQAAVKSKRPGRGGEPGSTRTYSIRHRTGPSHRTPPRSSGRRDRLTRLLRYAFGTTPARHQSAIVDAAPRGRLQGSRRLLEEVSTTSTASS